MNNIVESKQENNQLQISKEQQILMPIAENYISMFPEIANDKTFNAKQAVISMALKLKETKDKVGRPAIDVCTKESIMQVAQEVLVKRLDIMKSQASLIVRGDKLMLQSQYQGNVKRALELNPFLSHFNFVPIYKNDKVEMEINKDGSYGVKSHSTSFANISNNNLMGGYVRAIKKDGTVYMTEIMTMEQIKIAWSKSSSNQTVHKEFPLKMVRKTILNSLCAWLINTTGSQEEYADIEYSNEVPPMEITIDESEEFEEPIEQEEIVENDEIVCYDDVETESEEVNNEDEMTVYYSTWLNEYKDNGWEQVKGSYDKSAKTVRIRRC